ncbi:hypothetical protein K435DRAFT_857533 [Dendrothele bispora CBS 962.96]|uniref:Uncharacterized protein n=1 Tax=Dendrothele bispora (strain CBS 962.96) TaxID=1314807 RepID=A0A4S8M5I5_DENBC|nr:hypothetical protein K435DRAFT_857533 [Dendrothele bispora CBS 962.96]
MASLHTPESIDNSLPEGNFYTQLLRVETENANLREQLITLQANYDKLHSTLLNMEKKLMEEKEEKEAWKAHLRDLTDRMVMESKRHLENLKYDAECVKVMLDHNNPTNNRPLRQYYVNVDGDRVYQSDFGDEDSSSE